MPMQASEIESLLRETFPNARIVVEGDDGVHMSADVVDESFRGLNRVQQQRAVYAALKGKMDGSNGANSTPSPSPPRPPIETPNHEHPQHPTPT
jgi:acid stress-induced BolA-like protein IbaG/YrbA